MKRYPIVLCSVLLLFGTGCRWPGAQDEASAGTSVIVRDRVVTEDLVAGGQTVQVLADVQGDVTVAGADVTVAGPVSGYVMSAGRNVTIDGGIGNDLWAAGANVDISSRIGDNVMAAGRNVHLHPDAVVGHDARLAGRTVIAEGRVEHDLRIGASTAEIGADVGGTVEVQAREVIIRPGAVISGDLVVRAPQPPEISPQATVEGMVRFEETDEGGGWMARSWFSVLGFIGLLALGVVVLASLPTWVGRVAVTLRVRPGASALSGILVLILTPIVVGLLMMTVVGVPLALVLLALYVIVLLLSGVVVSYRVGGWLLDRMHGSQSRWPRLILGLVIVSLGIVLPKVGWLVVLAVLVMGVGALTLERRECRKAAAHPS